LCDVVVREQHGDATKKNFHDASWFVSSKGSLQRMMGCLMLKDMKYKPDEAMTELFATKFNTLLRTEKLQAELGCLYHVKTVDTIAYDQLVIGQQMLSILPPRPTVTYGLLLVTLPDATGAEVGVSYSAQKSDAIIRSGKITATIHPTLVSWKSLSRKYRATFGVNFPI